MQISLLTPLFNRLDLTRACLASLRQTFARWDYEFAGAIGNTGGGGCRAR